MAKRQVQPAEPPIKATLAFLEELPRDLKHFEKTRLDDQSWLQMERLIGDSENPIPPDYPVMLLSHEGPPIRLKVENSPNYVRIDNDSIIVVSIWSDGWIGVIN